MCEAHSAFPSSLAVSKLRLYQVDCIQKMAAPAFVPVLQRAVGSLFVSDKVACRHGISKMYFRYWKPPEVSERMWSVNLDASISGEYQTLGGHSYRPSE